MTGPSDAPPSVVVVGGGYGGINVAKALDDLADVTLRRSEGGLRPQRGLVAHAGRARVARPDLPPVRTPAGETGASFAIAPLRSTGRRVTLASGDVLEPDYLVLATGSWYPFPAKTEEFDIASARARLRAAHDALLAADRVLIVGAGPAGLELAGEIKAFLPRQEGDDR